MWFGSQTGTAEGYAKALAREASKHGFHAKALDLDGFSPSKLEVGGLSVFLMATYGEGDPTDNAVAFTTWLKDDARAPSLGALRFTVFGLGNRQYEHFNAMGKLVNTRLEALGAQRVYTFGEGDDEGNMEEDWEAWREGGLWAALHAAAGTAAPTLAVPPSPGMEPLAAGAAASVPERPAWRIVSVPPPQDAAALARGHGMSAASCSSAAATADVSSRHLFLGVPALVVANRELRQAPGLGASTRHVEVDLVGTGLTYATADNAFVCPENDEKTVAALAAWCGFDLAAWLTLEPSEEGDGEGGGAAAQPSPAYAFRAPFPTPCSVRTLLTRYVDLHGPPKRELLVRLAPYAQNVKERLRLLHLGSREGRDEFSAWVAAPQRSITEVLEAFPSIKLPLEAAVALLPRQAYRAYTIASSALVQPTVLTIVASVLDVPKPGGDAARRLRGVCSNHLARLTPGGGMCTLYVRPSGFRLPADPATPIVLVGPGTGIAPMRAFLHERRAQRVAAKRVGQTILFFGCRSRSQDFIYGEELQDFVRDGTLTALHLAFSREKAAKVCAARDEDSRLQEGGGWASACVRVSWVDARLRGTPHPTIS